jgi:hypothetical protein
MNSRLPSMAMISFVSAEAVRPTSLRFFPVAYNRKTAIPGRGGPWYRMQLFSTRMFRTAIHVDRDWVLRGASRARSRSEQGSSCIYIVDTCPDRHDRGFLFAAAKALPDHLLFLIKASTAKPPLGSRVALTATPGVIWYWPWIVWPCVVVTLLEKVTNRLPVTRCWMVMLAPAF